MHLLGKEPFKFLHMLKQWLWQTQHFKDEESQSCVSNRI